MSPRQHVQYERPQLVIWSVIILGFAPMAWTADGPRAKQPPPSPPAASAGVDPGWSQTIQENIRRSEYNFTQHGEGRWVAPNRATDLRTFVTSEGVEVVSRTRGAEALDLTLSLARWGRPGALASVDAGSQPPVVTVEDNRATIRHRGIAEWFVNDEHGLEHGFTIEERPAGEGPLVMELAVGGDLEPVADPRGESIRFENTTGAAILQYGSLVVRGADGRFQTARLVAEDHLVRLEIEDGGATYPLTIDPIMTSPTWTIIGDQASGGFGTSAASAGDVNGDGYSDVIIGAPKYDNGEIDEGRAYIYLGSASGLSLAASWTAEINQGGALFGGSVGSAGDVNADGFSDVVVGASSYSNGLSGQGAAFVYLGSASGVSATAGWLAEGDQAGAGLGSSVSTAGDVNGDGFSDLIIGAPYIGVRLAA